LEERNVLAPGGDERDKGDDGVGSAEQFSGHEHLLTLEGAGRSRSGFYGLPWIDDRFSR
jgi:hypothetical protein